MLIASFNLKSFMRKLHEESGTVLILQFCFIRAAHFRWRDPKIILNKRFLLNKFYQRQTKMFFSNKIIS